MSSRARQVAGTVDVVREKADCGASSERAGPLLGLVRIAGFRSARRIVFRPGPVCALVGEAGVGKSNLLAAVWTLLEPLAPSPGHDDLWRGRQAEIRIDATLSNGLENGIGVRPPRDAVRTGSGPPVIFLPAALRSDELIASPLSVPTPDAKRVAAIIRAAAGGSSSSAGPAAALVDALEACCRECSAGLVLLVEEPELFLRPQAQRYLYRLLRSFAANGNQVIYSTHAPAFVSVARLDELARVEHRSDAGTTIVQPRQLPQDDSFRALSEFDAERGELLFARAVLLVEGLTEKLVFPFLFRALGHDPDREAISIVECGGKPNILLFARICAATRVPYIAVHDRDAPSGRRPSRAEQVLNSAIAAVAGPSRTIELVPDFEGVSGLTGHSHKPAHAWRAFADAAGSEIPAPLADAVLRVLALARS